MTDIVYGKHRISAEYVREVALPRLRQLTRKVKRAEGLGACLEWSDAGSRYPTLNVKRSDGRWLTVAIHRFFAVIRFGNEACAGKEIDHLCRNTKCVNVKHLEPVSHLENVRRGAHGPGKALTPEWRAAIGRGLLGNTFRRGKKANAETRRRCSEGQKRRRAAERATR